MSAEYHTPIATGANANSAVFNAPMGTIDQAITDFLDASLAYEALLALEGTGVIDTSALITMISNSKGFLPPRMTAVQKNAIVSPATGLIVFDTTNVEPQIYDGSSWGGFSGSGVADMVLLETDSFNGALGAAITIDNISQEYQDLCLRLRIRGGGGGQNDTLFLRINNSSAAGAYQWRQLIILMNTAFPTVSFLNSSSDTEIEIRITGGTAAPNARYTELEIWLRNYRSASRSFGDFEGQNANNTGSDTYGAFEWVTGGAINRIDLVPSSGASFLKGSYALYGLGRQGEIEMLDSFSVPSGPPLASPLVTDNTGTWVFVQTDGQFSIT